VPASNGWLKDWLKPGALLLLAPLAALAQTAQEPPVGYNTGPYGGNAAWAWGWLWVIAAVIVLSFIVFGIFGTRRRTPPPNRPAH
jgi:hypothetical protein